MVNPGAAWARGAKRRFRLGCVLCIIPRARALSMAIDISASQNFARYELTRMRKPASFWPPIPGMWERMEGHSSGFVEGEADLHLQHGLTALVLQCYCRKRTGGWIPLEVPQMSSACVRWKKWNHLLRGHFEGFTFQ